MKCSKASFLFLGSLALAAAGCGGAGAPVVSEITLSKPNPAVGEEFLAMVLAEDLEGDLFGGKIDIELKALADGNDVELEQTVGIGGIPIDATQSDLIVRLQVFDVNPGAYDLKLVVSDRGGNRADAVRTSVTITGPMFFSAF